MVNRRSMSRSLHRESEKRSSSSNSDSSSDQERSSSSRSASDDSKARRLSKSPLKDKYRSNIKRNDERKKSYDINSHSNYDKGSRRDMGLGQGRGRHLTYDESRKRTREEADRSRGDDRSYLALPERRRDKRKYGIISRNENIRREERAGSRVDLRDAYRKKYGMKDIDREKVKVNNNKSEKKNSGEKAGGDIRADRQAANMNKSIKSYEEKNCGECEVGMTKQIRCLDRGGIGRDGVSREKYQPLSEEKHDNNTSDNFLEEVTYKENEEGKELRDTFIDETYFVSKNGLAKPHSFRGGNVIERGNNVSFLGGRNAVERDLRGIPNNNKNSINNENLHNNAVNAGNMIHTDNTTLIDRSKICPFLLRIFYKINGVHTLHDFAVRGKEPVEEELQIYTWADAKLRELIDLIKDVCEEVRERNAIWQFRLIYPDRSGRNVMTDIGTVHATKPNFIEDNKTLQSAKFKIGDYISLSINLENKKVIATDGDVKNGKYYSFLPERNRQGGYSGGFPGRR